MEQITTNSSFTRVKANVIQDVKPKHSFQQCSFQILQLEAFAIFIQPRIISKTKDSLSIRLQSPTLTLFYFPNQHQYQFIIQIYLSAKKICLKSVELRLFASVLLQFDNKSIMSLNSSQNDTHYHQVQGTIIIPVAAKKKDKLTTPKKSRRKHPPKGKPRIQGEYNEAPQSSFNDEGEKKQVEHDSQGKIRGADEQTMIEVEDNGLIQPYEFLSQRSPSIFVIFFPRYTWRSITFWLTITYIIMFLVLIGYNYSRTQTDLSWNCSLYKLQVKYFPRLRHQFQFWRIIMSAILHSNIAHFFLDIFSLQLYGYFVQWYFGRAIYGFALLISAVYSHLLSCLVQKTSIATTPSAVLFTILTMKAIFLWEYRKYKKLYQRRNFLYILLVLIVSINLIPIFVVNNIDFSAQLGGIIVGFCFGVYFVITKEEEQNCKTKVIRFGLFMLLALTLGLFIGLIFNDESEQYVILASAIGPRCESN